MRYAVDLPNFGSCADPHVLVDLAREAERAGWDGWFLWDHVLVDPAWEMEIADPWVALGAVAASTERLRIGTMVTPLPRRRPVKLARETTTLDRLSNGRVTLGVGLGWPSEAEFGWFGDEVDLAARARLLDEGLEVLVGLWSGEPFEHDGPAYHVGRARFLPTPVQRPRIPIWVGALRPFRDGPLRRAARWDGLVASTDAFDPVTPMELEVAVRRCVDQRDAAAGPFDVAVTGVTPGDDPSQAAAVVAAYQAAGATWWHELVTPMLGPVEAMRERIAAGPPQV